MPPVLLFLSCARITGPEEMVAEQATLTEVTAGQDSLVLYASFAGTKTDIGGNGRDVIWEEGDKIGVYAYNDGMKSYYCYTLAAGAGTNRGVFSGKAFDGELVGAFFPYSKMLPTKKKPVVEGHSSFLFTLPSSYDGYETSDFKVATSLERDGEGNSHLTFSQKLTLLDFAVTFPDEMRDDRVLNFQMSASAKLTGAFYMDVEDPSSAVEPTDDCFSTVETVFGGKTGLAIPSDGVLRFRMVVLPTVRNDEKISFSITTASRVYTFWLRAAKDYLGGYRYTMSIDLGALEAAGRLDIQSNPDWDFLYKCTDPCVFDFQKSSFVIRQSPRWQCSWNSSAFRFQDWGAKSVAVIGHPGTMGLDQTYDLSISTIGSVGVTLPRTSSAKVIRIDAASGTCWLHDEANGLGYIILTK